MFLLLTLLLCPLASTSDCGKHGSCLNGEDETTLLQVTRTTKLGNEQKQSTSPSEKGEFKHLKSDLSDECNVEGIFLDGQNAPVKFRSKSSEVLLEIAGLPILLHRDHGGRGNRSIIELDGVHHAYSQEDVSNNNALMKGLKQHGSSPFASSGAEKMSNLLGNNGLEGVKSLCTAHLHLVLLMLAKAAVKRKPSQKPRTGAGLFGGTVSAEWKTYGHDAQCPSWRQPEWECTCDGKTWERGGAQGGTRCDKLSIDCRPLAAEDMYGNVIGKTKFQEECGGMCGATCHCWRGLCGANYACGYNGMCCAHDYACTIDGMVSVACALEAADVLSACRNNQDVLAHPRRWGHDKEDERVRIRIHL